MSLKRQIKTQLIIFVVVLAAFVATFLYLFQKNYHQFNVEIYSRSKDNLEIIEALSKVDTNLHIHKNSLFRYINTGNKKWLNYLKDAETGIDQQFQFLEQHNKNEFQLWVPVQGFFESNGREALEKEIVEAQTGNSEDGHFQRLFYLVRFNIQQYFKQSDTLIKKHELSAFDSQSLIPLDKEEQYVKLIYTGINELVTAYNKQFWDYAKLQNSKYHQNTNYYFRTLMISSIFILLFAIFILVRITRYFYVQQLRNENLALLGAKDLVTGLFNNRSFEILGGQELERARRRGYHLSLLLIRVDPFEQIKADLGDVAVDRLLFQVAELLRKCIRVYDGIYKYDENSFVVMLSETDFKSINTIVERFKVRFFKTAFVVKKSKLKVIPQVSVGFAVFPTDADKLEGLVHFAQGNLSANFDAFSSHQPEEDAKLSAKAANQNVPKKDLHKIPEQSDHHVQEVVNQTALNEMFESAEEPADPKWAPQAVQEAESAANSVQNASAQEVVDPGATLKAVEDMPESEDTFSGEVSDQETEGSEAKEAEETSEDALKEGLSAQDSNDSESSPAEALISEDTEESPEDHDAKNDEADPEASQSVRPISLSDEEAQKLAESLGVETGETQDVDTPVMGPESMPDPDLDIPDVVAALNQDDSDQSQKEEISVLETAAEDDVITVDFDREPEDLAMSFRRKQKKKRQKL